MLSFEIGDVSPPSVLEPARLAVSPDGTRIVYPSLERTRPALSEACRPSPGAVGAAGCPFFSPDGESIGVYDGLRMLTRVSVRGGAPTVIANVGVDTRGSSEGAGGLTIASSSPRHSASTAWRRAVESPSFFALARSGPERALLLHLPRSFPAAGPFSSPSFHEIRKPLHRVAALDLDSLERKTVVTDGAGRPLRSYRTSRLRRPRPTASRRVRRRHPRDPRRSADGPRRGGRGRQLRAFRQRHARLSARDAARRGRDPGVGRSRRPPGAAPGACGRLDLSPHLARREAGGLRSMARGRTRHLHLGLRAPEPQSVDRRSGRGSASPTGAPTEAGSSSPRTGPVPRSTSTRAPPMEPGKTSWCSRAPLRRCCMVSHRMARSF